MQIQDAKLFVHLRVKLEEKRAVERRTSGKLVGFEFSVDTEGGG